MSEQQCQTETSDSAGNLKDVGSEDDFQDVGILELLDLGFSDALDNKRICFDPVLMHTLSLLKYRRNMFSTRSDLETVPEQNEQKPKLFSLPFDDTNMTEDSIMEIISRSIMLLSAHVGFEGIENSALAMLRFVVIKHFQRVWDIMSVCDRRRSCGRNSAFACSFLQVLRILRIEDVKDIAEFYRRRILMRRNSLYSLCVREHEKVVNERQKRKAEADEGQNATKLRNAKRQKLSEC